MFGSWTARYEGEPGPWPKDVDIVVVGETAQRAIRRACRDVERDLRIEINPIVIDLASWDSPESELFIAHIKEQPLVLIPVDLERGT